MTEELTQEQLNELTAIKSAFVSILKDNDDEEWSDLDNERRKAVLPKVDLLVSQTIPQEDRFFALVYTIRDDKIEMAVLAKELAKTFAE